LLFLNAELFLVNIAHLL